MKKINKVNNKKKKYKEIEILEYHDNIIKYKTG